MFQASANRLRTWLRWTEDILGDPPDDTHDSNDSIHLHPHRRPLRWDRARRPGTVEARPAHCISPLRGGANPAHRDWAAR
jgi:hypothetical protein